MLFLRYALLPMSMAALSWDSINSPLAQQRIQQLMEVAGPLECVDAIVDDFCDEYPELHPSTEKGVLALKLQLNYFFNASRNDQDQGLQGNSSHFVEVAKKIAQLKEIAQREMAKLQGKQRGMYEDPDHFITSHLIISMVRLHQRRSAFYVRRGLSEPQIRKEIEKKQAELWHSWHRLGSESYCSMDEELVVCVQ